MRRRVAHTPPADTSAAAAPKPSSRHRYSDSDPLLDTHDKGQTDAFTRALGVESTLAAHNLVPNEVAAQTIQTMKEKRAALEQPISRANALLADTSFKTRLQAEPTLLNKFQTAEAVLRSDKTDRETIDSLINIIDQAWAIMNAKSAAAPVSRSTQSPPAGSPSDKRARTNLFTRGSPSAPEAAQSHSSPTPGHRRSSE